MGEFVDWCQTNPNGVRIYAGRSHDFHDSGMGLRADAPNMEVHKFCVAWTFHQLPNFFGNMLVGPIQQDGRGVPHEIPRPSGNDDCADYSHGRIEPNPAEIAARKQRHDGKNGRKGVRDNVSICGAQVAVFATMPMALVVAMVMVLSAVTMAS